MLVVAVAVYLVFLVVGVRTELPKTVRQICFNILVDVLQYPRPLRHFDILHGGRRVCCVHRIRALFIISIVMYDSAEGVSIFGYSATWYAVEILATKECSNRS